MNGAANKLKRDHKLRIRLFRDQEGLCHWCRAPMLLVIGRMADGSQPFRRQPMPTNLATLDHLDSKLSGERGAHGYGETRKVAACFKCNSERGGAEHAALPINEQRARSGRFPRATESA